MIIKSIDIAGATNTLRYAISKGIPIFNNQAIVNLIESEMYFMVTYADVTMLETFLFAQKYRDNMWILKSDQPEMPDDDELSVVFTGEVMSDDKQSKVKTFELAKTAIDQFLSIYKQMLSDFDIIQPGVAIEFAPMISRRYEIRIPVPFSLVLGTFQDEDSFKEFFSILNTNGNNEIVTSSKYSGLMNTLSTLFVRNTSIPIYDKAFVALVNAIKYGSLNRVQSDKLYRYKLIGVNKRNREKSEDYFSSMFNTTKDELQANVNNMTRFAGVPRANFAVELPVQNMLKLLNSFSSEELPVNFMSSMKQMVDMIEYLLNNIQNGIVNPSLDLSNPEAPALVEVKNRVDAYITRINEATGIMLTAIQKMIELPDQKCDVTSIFALLPSIVLTRAVIEVSDENIGKLMYRQDDPVNIAMFNDISLIIESIDDQFGNK